ncbi:RdgB/HAM1 family non-canonical purine NTP pyrophosphatase [Parashewanella curva]|uniref:dITP/XTP pyrophosphatase n=1 Tax=Parashewanella curva TaxID=2338552 RepID=A0A3L8PSN7_9GAMM|nr:RdgB/HAM1 family non-canonical purine NTP pyrophosphatase [Parashewanella curva]RLV58264.1 RdgB/HAM1 family non-canonical purine NTP pyrophosphatase [Parashewanella curva]
MKTIVLASGNKGKLAEFDQLFNQHGVSIIPQSDFDVPEVAETGTTFVENAIIKARHAAKYAKGAVIADDSGIEVDRLQGQPGIYSARYSGEGASAASNNEKLLSEMNSVSHRTARFQCVLVYMRHELDPTPIIAQASWEGEIAQSLSGDGGHGYDPLFIPEGYSESAASMSADAKNAVSHRGKALQQLVALLKQHGVIN